MSRISRTSSTEVTVTNPNEFIYLKGDVDTDGSLRLLPDRDDENFEFQLRFGGVWNPTGIQIAASTIHLGREFLISAFGEFQKTNALNSGTTALIPQINYTDAGSTVPYQPVLGAKLIDVFVQNDDTTVFTGTSISSSQTSPLLGVRTKIIWKSGNVAATAPVTFSVYRGVDNTGVMLLRVELPASDFGVDMEVPVIPGDGFQLDDMETVYTEFTSDESFTMRGNAGGELWLKLDVFPLSFKNLLTTDDLGANFTGQASQIGNTTPTVIPAVDALVKIGGTSWSATLEKLLAVGADGQVDYTGMYDLTATLDARVYMEPFVSLKDLSTVFGVAHMPGYPVTFTNATNLVDEVAHSRNDGDILTFANNPGTLPLEIRDDIFYYVVSSLTDSFQLSYTEGGAAIAFTDDGTGTRRYCTATLYGFAPVENIQKTSPVTLSPMAMAPLSTGDIIHLLVQNKTDSVNIVNIDTYMRVFG
jgi:hypothetical protein